MEVDSLMRAQITKLSGGGEGLASHLLLHPFPNLLEQETSCNIKFIVLWLEDYCHLL
jgi:hypothetical protein